MDRNHPGLRKYILKGVRRTGVTLGCGSFGSVVEVKISGAGDMIFAGKIWHEILLDPRNEGVDKMVQKFIAECELMSQLRHQNLVEFVGICFVKKSLYPILVMERLHTSLDDLLEQNKDIFFGIKLRTLLDISNGLVYLHDENDPPIIHRDLTARNVLLNEDSSRAKIADLGNARMIEPGRVSGTLSMNPGTLVYMPPEACRESAFYDSSLDIFSFGHLALYAIIQVFPDKLLPHNEPDPITYVLTPNSEVARRGKYMEMLHSKIGKTHSLSSMIEECLHDVPKFRLANIIYNAVGKVFVRF